METETIITVSMPKDIWNGILHHLQRRKKKEEKHYPKRGSWAHNTLNAIWESPLYGQMETDCVWDENDGWIPKE